MAVKTKEEIMNALKQTFGDNLSDDNIALLEDVSDTFDSNASSVQEANTWKEKYQQNDADWRKKYTERFYGKPDDNNDDDSDDDKPDGKPLVSFNQLFN